MAPSRRVVVAGGPSGREPRYESLNLDPAIEQVSTSVHEICEVGPDGALGDGALPWHHDPEPDGAILRLVTLGGAVAGAAPKGLHSSPTIDIGVIVQGAVTLVLPGEKETSLAAGDSFVLRGVDHAWRNDAPDPCVMAVTLLKPSAWPGVTAS